LDRRFIEEIYEGYYGLVKLIVKNTIHSTIFDDITSCVQEVFLIAMQKDGLEKHDNIKAWLLLTTKNVAKTFNRQMAIRSKYVYLIPDHTALETYLDDFSDSLIEKSELERLHGMDLNQIIIESLSQNERDFYALLMKGLDFKEISKVLNISEGSAATRRSRLYENIKNILENL
jgi:RNA polymerase sigma factor (sigma-70 family)